MANKIDFDSSPAFKCFKQLIKSSLKQIGLEINTDEKQKIIVGYGKDNDNDVIENDWFLPNQYCFVFVVPNVDEVRFEQEEYVYSEVPSFLFIGRDFRTKFYDAESLGWNKDENDKLYFKVQDDEYSFCEILAFLNDDYFKGLSLPQICELAKKSIRVTKDNCDMTHRLEDLLEKAKVSGDNYYVNEITAILKPQDF